LNDELLMPCRVFDLDVGLRLLTKHERFAIRTFNSEKH